MKTRQEKITYLKLLIIKVKQYYLKELEVLLELEFLESVLNMPEMVSQELEKESIKHKKIIDDFLNSYIRILEKVIQKMENINE